MADNTNIENTETVVETKKYFLDLVGLTTLWNKIKSTFADKSTTETELININSKISTVQTDIQEIENDVDTLETTILSYAPKEVDNYSAAIEASKTLTPGTVLKVLNDETIEAEDGTESTYMKGLYIVESSGVVKYLGTSSGSNTDSGIDGLNSRVTDIEENMVSAGVVVSETGTSLGTYQVSSNNLIIVHDDSFDIDSSSINALTHRAVAAKFKEMANQLTSIPKFKIAVVDELPTSGISLSTIYLLKNDQQSTNNMFTEYIYVETVADDPETTETDESVYKWEKLGEQTLELSDIVTQTQMMNAINVALADYAKTTTMEDFVTSSVNSATANILTTVSETYLSKEDAEATYASEEDLNSLLDTVSNEYLSKNDAATTYLSKNDAATTYLSKDDASKQGWMTEADIIVSIQSGNIGDAITITDEQIDDLTATN